MYFTEVRGGRREHGARNGCAASIRASENHDVFPSRVTRKREKERHEERGEEKGGKGKKEGGNEGELACCEHRRGTMYSA